jgi:laminin alpha 3/5|uniref:Laminin subunit alpha-5-like n=1 Tax=Castor canadensis TaxID=51338 RepID=A0A8B7V9Z4_CASCN|nr:laminin subunit alpha-5-like [Castor canadensis]
MAKRGARLCALSALRAGGSRGPAPPPPLLLLAGLLLLGAARARAPADGGFSLHPPYFNLAEGARIAASATCGEEAPARGAPRPTEDLYCKLVGGPVAGGDPNQTIQVSAGRGSGYTAPMAFEPGRLGRIGLGL